MGSSGAVSAGGSPSIDGGASAGVADQQPSPSAVAAGKEVRTDDRDLLGRTTNIHRPEVRAWCFASFRSGLVLLFRLSVSLA